MNRILTFLLSCALSVSLTGRGEAPGPRGSRPRMPSRRHSRRKRSPRRKPGRSCEYTVEELSVKVDGHGFSGDNFDLAMGYLLD